MILYSAVASSLYGLYALISGKFILGRGRHLLGAQARQVGAWWALVFPATIITGYVYTWLYRLIAQAEPIEWIGVLLRAVVMLVLIIAAQNLAVKYYLQSQESIRLEKPVRLRTYP